jgi:hypothetical protein
MTSRRDARVVVAVISVGLAVTAAAAGTPGTATRSTRVPSSSIQFLSQGPGRANPQSLYAVDARGGGKLREVLVDVEEAHWSPDGKRLAFLRVLRGKTRAESRIRLFVTAPGGRRPRVVTSYPGSGTLRGEWSFSWSPDSRRIAYASQQGIHVVGADGKRDLRIYGAGRAPVWAPDGREIAFTVPDGTPPNGGTLYVARADAGAVSIVRSDLGVTTTSVFSLSPQAWSPDGSRIAAAVGSGGFAIIELATGRTRTFDGSNPAWAPNGRWIAASGRRGVWVMRPDGTGKGVFASSLLVGNGPVWSRDSRALAVTGWCCPPYYEGDDVWTISIPDGQTRRITEGDRYEYPNYGPEWHPTRAGTARLPGRYVSGSIPTDSVVDGGVFKTTAPIARIAADDAAVVLGKVLTTGRSCRTEVWQPAQRRVTAFPECGTSPALAGDRVLWTYGPVGWGDGERWFALTSTLTRPRATTLPRPWRTGRPLGPPAGDGSLAVFALWGPCLLILVPSTCTDESRKPGELYRLDGETLVRVTTSPTALTPLSVDAGRILVDHEDGTLELLRPDGTSIRTFPLNRSIVRGVRLQGRDLVVQTTSAVELTNADNGEFVRRWPLPSANPRLEDVQNGIAVFVDGRLLTLLRLRDGERAVIEVPTSQDVLAQIEPSGLFYSYRAEDSRYPGRVVFVPSQNLPLTVKTP